jgi:hypothetical protein
LRLDDWGVSYMLGQLAEGNKGTRWTLLETGSWVSPGCWYSMCGEKRLVFDSNGASGDAQPGASGPLCTWKEQRNDVDLGHFEERRREVFCSLNIGEEKGCVYRLSEQQLMRAACGQQIRVLNWQTPTVLDALRWVPVEEGTWEVRNDHFEWVSTLEQGHRFEPLDLDSDLGRQQLALATGQDAGKMKDKKKRSQEQGGNEGIKRAGNGLMPKAKAAVLGKASVERVGSSASGLAWGDGERCRQNVAGDKDPINDSPVSEHALGVSSQLCTKKKLHKAGQRAQQREAEAEARQGGVQESKGGTSPGDHTPSSTTSQGGEHKAQSRKCERAKCVVSEDLGASRPKRKRTGAPTIESDEASREARKLAKQKREQEKKALAQQLEKQGLCLVEIPADGHCLFSAINDQLKRSNSIAERQHTYKSLRRCAAKYMLEVRNVPSVPVCTNGRRSRDAMLASFLRQRVA